MRSDYRLLIKSINQDKEIIINLKPGSLIMIDEIPSNLKLTQIFLQSKYVGTVAVLNNMASELVSKNNQIVEMSNKLTQDIQNQYYKKFEPKRKRSKLKKFSIKSIK